MDSALPVVKVHEHFGSDHQNIISKYSNFIYATLVPFNIRFGLRALTPKERNHMMSSFKRSLSTDVYAEVSSIALEVLGEEQWRDRETASHQ
jgi:hypothetical protein